MVSGLEIDVPLDCLVPPWAFPLFGKNMVRAGGPHEQTFCHKFLLKRLKHKLFRKSIA